MAILEPRAHYAGAADLPGDVAREQGAMLARVERAVWQENLRRVVAELAREEAPS